MDIVYEDNHLIIVNKSAGELSQSDYTKDLSLVDKVKNYIKTKYKKPGNVYLGLVNRLDRPTSGLVIFSKTSKSLARMNKLLKERKIKKIYHAVTEKSPNPKKGTLINFLKKNQIKNKSFIVNENELKSKKAILHYTLIKKLKNFFLIEIMLETGRHHQIRSQLANIGCVIKGDVKYGAKRANKDKSICLHAKNIEFIHPITKAKISLDANPPKSNIWSN
jgi:23S rRNA pseudouridine1911/1915/1917 synthase|tara:strand:+ start:911 stop:1570 length:660 start_codon:yes stop_codon:yes gene_type:complete